MPETKRPLKVFLCHASADKPKVRELYRYLRRRGIRPWFDEIDLIGGQDWQVEIPKAIATSDAIIICLTKNSIDKEGYIQKEIKFALDKALEMPEGRIYLIPVRFEECEVPFTLRRYQWVDLFDQIGFTRLMKSLKTRAGQLERANVQIPKSNEPSPNLASAGETGHDAIEKAEREKAEKASQEQLERERAEKTIREEIEHKAAEEAARAKKNRETAKKSTQDKTKTDKHQEKSIKKGFFGDYFKRKKRVLEAAIEKRVQVDKPASLFVWIRRQGIKNIIHFIPRIDENIHIDEDKVKSKDIKLEFPVKSGRVYPTGISIKLVAPDFNLVQNQKNIIVPPDDDSVICTFTVIPRKAGDLLLTIEVYKDGVLLGNRSLYTEAAWSAPLIAREMLIVRVPVDDVFKPRKTNIAIIVALIGFAGTIIAGLLGSPLIGGWFSPPPTATPTMTTASIVSTSTEPNLVTPSPPTNPVIATAISYSSIEIRDSKDISMMFIPVGEFLMGSMKGDSDEQPVHTIYLSAYYIDKYEVTNKLYKACVSEGVCTAPHSSNSETRQSYYDNAQFDNYPVINVDWNQSKAYCEWRGARLPTEAEWEKAARGTDGRTYPWGEGIDCSRANYGGCGDNDTTEVGNYESGKSPFGVYDMLGNVYEWVEDWYSDTYYQNSPSSNPRGPELGQEHVLRGGSWKIPENDIRSTFRYKNVPDGAHGDYGFRCARSIGGPATSSPSSTTSSTIAATTSGAALFPTRVPALQLTDIQLAAPTETSFPIDTAIANTPQVSPTIPALQISLIQSFLAPGSHAEGLTWDGVYLWVTDNSAAIFKVDPSGNVFGSVSSPEGTPKGITWNGSSFWVFTTNRSFIHQFQIVSGNIQTISSFRSPAEFIGGDITQDLAWDGGSLWYANQFNVYDLDISGNILTSFTSPKNVAGLDWDGSNLWLAYNDFRENATLKKVNTGGEVLESYPSPIFQINSLAWADGYLWVLGLDAIGGDPMIYKLAISQ